MQKVSLQDMIDLNEGKRTVPRGEEANPPAEKSGKQSEETAQKPDASLNDDAKPKDAGSKSAPS